MDKQKLVERLSSEAVQFNTRAEWKASDGGKGYGLAKFYKILAACTGHMKDQREVKNYSDEEAVSEGHKYTSVKEWKKGAYWSYRIACRRQLKEAWKNIVRCPTAAGPVWLLYRYSFPDGALYWGITCTPKTRWPRHASGGPVFNYQVSTKQLPVHEILKTEMFLAEAQMLERQHIRADRTAGLKVLNKHDGGGSGNISLWRTSDGQLREIAKKYDSRSQWEREDGRAYRLATRRGILEECCAHMTRLCKVWTLDDMKACAAPYPSRFEFSAKEVACAAYARRYGVYGEITKHMPKHIATARAASKPKPEPRFLWTADLILADALLYPSKTKWARGNRAAYNAAVASGIFEAATAHMKRPPRLNLRIGEKRSPEARLKMSIAARNRCR